MKIGIVTVTYVNNFGSHLQSFALQQTIRSLGFQTEIISPKGLRRQISKRRLIYLLSRLYDVKEIKSYITVFKMKIATIFDKEYGNILKQRAAKFNSFADNEYCISPLSTSWEELKSLCSGYSTVVIGSDQNWRPANIAGGYYTLEYVPDNINKVAYSTSFGISKVITSQRKKAKYFLNRINHISIREDTGRMLIKELINRDVPVVCDPTILITRAEWDKYIETKCQTDLKETIQAPYILCYFLGENPMHRKFAQRLKEKTGYRIVSILLGEERYYKENPDFYDEGVICIGPLDFVKLISKAEYVCTDSFHGCAFSLIFQKELFAFYKSSSNSKMSVNDRLDSMLGWAGIKNRIITEDGEITEDKLNPIDYVDVGRKVEEKRKISMDFLKNSLQ